MKEVEMNIGSFNLLHLLLFLLFYDMYMDSELILVNNDNF